MALISMPWRKVCFPKRAPLYCPYLMCLFTSFFFTPFAFLVFFPPASRIEYIFWRRPTYPAIARPAHSSFNFPRAFFWPNCTEGGPGESQTCRRSLRSGSCPCTHPRSQSQGEVVSVRVEELAALSVLHFELVVIVHQVLGEFQNANAHIHRAIEY